nr:hypothetical protein [Tanacetum cinerariifolium]
MISPEMRETKAYKTYLGYATGVTPSKKVRKFKNTASPKHTTVPASSKEPIKKSKRVKRPTKKSTNAPTSGVVIRDTPGVFISKKKAPPKADRGKGIELLLNATLLEDAQLKKALMKSRQETHKLQASGSSKGADFESEILLRVTTNRRESDDDNESDDNDDEGSENNDDSGNDAQDSGRSDSDEYENPNLNLNEFDDEEYDDLYKDVNVRSKVAEHKEVRKKDVEIPNATRESGSQEKSYEQVVEDAHVTLTTLQKTEGSKQSSSVSYDFASKYLILDNVPPVVDEVTSIMNVKSYTSEFKKKVQEEKDRYIDLVEKSIKDIIKDEVKSQLPQILPKEVSDFATLVIQSAINESLENVILAISSSQLKSTYEAAASLTEFELKKILLDKIQKRKLACDDKDKDEDSSAGSDKGLKKRKTSKDAEPPKGLNTKESKSSLSKGTKSQSKSSRKSVQAEKPEFKVVDSDMPQNQEGNLVNDKEPMRGVTSKYGWFIKPKQPQEPINPDWNVVTWVEVIRKHGYRYMREIEIQRADNKLYTFKEGDFPRLRINDIKDMLIVVAQNKLTNILGDHVSDFAIALRMFTRSMVIQKRVIDLQLEVESY